MSDDKVPVVAWRVSGSGQVWALRKTNPHGWTYIQPLVLATDYEAAIARAEAAEALLRQVIDAHTGENIDGCGMTNAQLSEIAAQQAGG